MSNKNDFEIVLTKYNGNDAHVVVPDCVTYIGGYAFAGNRNLTTLIVSDHVKDIAYTAFWDCDNLERIKIGKGLEKFSDVGLIGDCANFKGFEVDEENKHFKAINGDLYTKDGDFLCYAIGKKEESFTVPFGMRKIGPWAFNSCQYLRSVTIPEGVEEIGECAFGFTSLKEVVLPKSLNEIGEDIFNGANKIDIIIKAPKGSYAIKWAKKNKMKYEEI
ncbi:MAG: leucine-rich repeat domain-containing protein [Clostridia bacterium]|nr:leucine-rich repeat domain-containing protein [Clostridia bacterium]